MFANSIKLPMNERIFTVGSTRTKIRSLSVNIIVVLEWLLQRY